jgi:hypothetical protein
LNAPYPHHGLPDYLLCGDSVKSDGDPWSVGEADELTPRLNPVNGTTGTHEYY